MAVTLFITHLISYKHIGSINPGQQRTSITVVFFNFQHTMCGHYSVTSCLLISVTVPGDIGYYKLNIIIVILLRTAPWIDVRVTCSNLSCLIKRARNWFDYSTAPTYILVGSTYGVPCLLDHGVAQQGVILNHSLITPHWHSPSD